MPSKGSGNDAWERQKRLQTCPTTGSSHEWRQVPANHDDLTSQYRCDKCRVIANATRNSYGGISLDLVSETPSPIRMIEDRRLTDVYPTMRYADESTLDGRRRGELRSEFAEEARRSAEYSASPGSEPSVMRKITSMEALQFILDEIKNSPDPFAASGKWLTLFTNGVAAIIREEQ